MESIKKERRKRFIKQNFTQVRVDKESKYKKIDTREYNSLVDVMKAHTDKDYITTGKNSLERELIIIDCDDTDNGENTLKRLERFHIPYNYQKIKTNGHSQTGIFIDKTTISGFLWGDGIPEAKDLCFSITAYDDGELNPLYEKLMNDSKLYNDLLNVGVIENTRIFKEKIQLYPNSPIYKIIHTVESLKGDTEYYDICNINNPIDVDRKINSSITINNHKLYLLTTRLLNLFCNGDIGFTGFNCQNPYSKLSFSDTKWNMDESNRIDLFDLFLMIYDNLFVKDIQGIVSNLKKKLNEMKNIDYERIKAIRKSDSQNGFNNKIYNKKIENDSSELETIVEQIENNTTLDNVCKFISKYDTSYDKKIYVDTSKIYQKYRNTLSLMEIRNKCVNTILEMHHYDVSRYYGYSDSDIISHVSNAIMHISKNYDNNKASYDNSQRDLAFAVRKANAFMKMHKYAKLMEKGFSIKEASKIAGISLASAYNYNKKTDCGISLNSVENLLKLFEFKSFNEKTMIYGKYINSKNTNEIIRKLIELKIKLSSKIESFVKNEFDSFKYVKEFLNKEMNDFISFNLKEKILSIE